MPQERLQKILSQAGLMSRRHAEEAIKEGRVSVNGQIIRELGSKADSETDTILLDGKPVTIPELKTTILLHKPRKVMTTKNDPEGRKTVMDLLPTELSNVNPVGRLDYESEGLLILTNDGDLALKLTHPRYGIKKVYLASVRERLSRKSIDELTSGVTLEDGRGRFATIQEKHSEGAHWVYEVTVTEGRNRFVRRMLHAVGHPVERLVRIRMGPYELGNLEAGAYEIV
jgi:pseudouridine synthase